MKRCKHAIVESYWNTSVNKETGKMEEYDLDRERVPHSSRGIWQKPMIICGFTDSADEQFKKNCGFFYCDEKRCQDCEFYEFKENGKKIITKNRDPIDSRLRHECFKRDKYKCVECGKTTEETTLHADHILPVSQGGKDELNNLQTLCQACNLAKSNRCWKTKN